MGGTRSRAPVRLLVWGGWGLGTAQAGGQDTWTVATRSSVAKCLSSVHSAETLSRTSGICCVFGR